MNYEAIVNALQSNYPEVFEAIRAKNPGLFGMGDGFKKVVRIDRAMIEEKKRALRNVYGRNNKQITRIFHGA